MIDYGAGFTVNEFAPQRGHMGLASMAERGGKSGKKRAIIAVARKLAVLLHHLWVSGEVYRPLRNSKQTAMPAAA